MPRMLTLNERIDGFAGRVSATRVRLTVAVPPPVQLVVQGPLSPLQEETKKTVINSTGKKRRVFLRFMLHPTTE